jgi:hypothetical protein
MFLFEHDLFGKPVPTFPDHALVAANYGCLRQMRIASIDLAQFFFMLLGRARMRANE